MESITDDAPLVVIIGPTASGKTALALRLAACFDGEIIAADSRTVYRGMDIGTAKPTPAERALVSHHLLDVVDPDQPFTVADFQCLAREAIRAIVEHGNLPFLVGGSGLYVDAVIYNFSLRPVAAPAERQALQKLSVDELQEIIRERGIALPTNARNPRHLVRALETDGVRPARTALRPRTIIIGLSPDRSVLRQKITDRVEQMIAAGFVDEVRRLSERYGWDVPALQAPGYRAFRRYLQNELSLEEAKQLFVQSDMQYAKRQLTWFKRNPDIHWISKPEETVEFVTTLLNK